MPRKFTPVKVKQREKLGGTNWLLNTLFRVLKHRKLSLLFSDHEQAFWMLTSEELNLKDTNIWTYNQAKKYLIEIRSSSHKYSLMCKQGTGWSYYNGPFACYVVYMFLVRFQSKFSICNFGIRTLLFNFNKTLFELRSLCTRFLRCIYLLADTRMKQIMF